MGHFPTFSLKWSLLNIHLYFLCDEQGGNFLLVRAGTMKAWIFESFSASGMRQVHMFLHEQRPCPQGTSCCRGGTQHRRPSPLEIVLGWPIIKKSFACLKPPGRDKVLNTYSWPFPKFNALLKIINTWWNGHHHFTQPRFPQTVTPKIINWKTMRINHSNISFMGGIYYEKWKTSVEFSNNWLLAEFVLSAARVAPEGVGRAVAVEESKEIVECSGQSHDLVECWLGRQIQRDTLKTALQCLSLPTLATPTDTEGRDKDNTLSGLAVLPCCRKRIRSQQSPLEQSCSEKCRIWNLQYCSEPGWVNGRRERATNTGWSKETVNCNFLLADPKISKSVKTQWFLGSLYREVLVFFKSVRCVEFCLLKNFQFIATYKAWTLKNSLTFIQTL